MSCRSRSAALSPSLSPASGAVVGGYDSGAIGEVAGEAAVLVGEQEIELLADRVAALTEGFALTLGDAPRRVLRHDAETACVLIFLFGKE